MKKEIKGFAIGIIAATALTAITASAINSLNIDVYPNTVQIYANGHLVKSDNFTYNDTTYVPLRAVLELMDCTVDYDSSTRTVFAENTLSQNTSEESNKNLNTNTLISSEMSEESNEPPITELKCYPGTELIQYDLLLNTEYVMSRYGYYYPYDEENLNSYFDYMQEDGWEIIQPNKRNYDITATKNNTSVRIIWDKKYIVIILDKKYFSPQIMTIMEEVYEKMESVKKNLYEDSKPKSSKGNNVDFINDALSSICSLNSNGASGAVTAQIISIRNELKAELSTNSSLNSYLKSLSQKKAEKLKSSAEKAAKNAYRKVLNDNNTAMSNASGAVLGKALNSACNAYLNTLIKSSTK